MQVAQFPASAANSLIEGYCDDFVSLAAVLAQTIEQVTMRGIALSSSRAPLERIETGMRQLADAIQELLQKQPAKGVRPTAPAAPGTARPSAAAPPVQQVTTQVTTPVTTPVTTQVTTPVTTPATPQTTPQTLPTGVQAKPAQPRPPAPRELGRTATPPPRRSQDNLPLGQTERPGVLRGNNQSMPVRSVFQFLGRMRKSGTFTIHLDHEALTFEFQNGCVVCTTSSLGAPNERLGELLIELGFTQRPAIEAALRNQEAGEDRLGHFLINERIATNGQVLEALELQVRRRFARACECRDASYEFAEGQRKIDDGRIRIAPMELNFTPPT